MHFPHETPQTSKSMESGNKIANWGNMQSLRALRTYYEPVAKDQRKLDVSINRKFDLSIVSVLVIDFVLQAVHRSDISFAAAGSSKF
jgi:hypothetical protein